jgi:hypothetical protein
MWLYARITRLSAHGIDSTGRVAEATQPVLLYSSPRDNEGNSSTTNLQVVFEANSKTTSGVSLNEKLMVGSKPQDTSFPYLLYLGSMQYP